MADLTFIDKLDENQLTVADKIVAKAKEMGVPPRLALSLAYVESGLRMDKTGGAGEIGIMQVKPPTGKLLGFDEKALRTEDGNINAGLTYLKQGIERYKDPMLGVVAYNAGHDNDFLLGKSDEPPKTTVQYINKIDALGGFTAPEAPTEGSEGVEGAASIEGAAIPPAPKAKPSLDLGRTGEAAALGAMAGATLGEGKKLFGGKPAVAAAPTPAAPSPAAARAPAAPAAGGRMPAPGGPNVPPPAGGRGTFNYGKATLGLADIDAARAADYGDAWKVAKEVQAAEQKIGPGWKMATDRANLMLPDTVGSGPRGVARAPIPPVAPAKTPLGGKIMSGVRGAGNFLARSPVISGALAGAGVAGGAQEAMTRWNQGDVPGAVVSGLGAFGSGISALPSPITKAVGFGLATASPAALYVLDKMRQKEQGALPAQQTAP